MLRVVIPPRHPMIRMARRLAFLFSYALTFLAGLAVGLLLVGYQVRVAADSMRTWGARLVTLESQYEREHPGLKVSKAAAQVITQRKEDARRERE